MKMTAQQKDLFNLPTVLCMEKYNFNSVQNVYDRKNAVKRKLEEAGLNLDKTLKKPDAVEDEIGVGMMPQKAKAAVNGATHKAAIEGTPKKAAAKKTAAKKTVAALVEEDPIFFTIEETPPPMKMGATEAKEEMLNKTKKLFFDTKFGGAIIVPTVNRVLIVKHLRKEFPTVDLRPEVIDDNPKATRIYKFKELKP